MTDTDADAARPDQDRRDGRRADLRGTARERLLDAAAAELAEHGYGATSMHAIAKRAGLTRGALYWNFESRQQLFLELVEQRLDAPARELIRLTASAAADQPTAADVSRGLTRLVADQGPLVMLLFEHWAAAVRDPGLRAAFDERQRMLRQALARALAARHDATGVRLTYPAERLATAILALAHGVAMSELVDPDATPAELFGETLDLLYDGLVHRAAEDDRGDADR